MNTQVAEIYSYDENKKEAYEWPMIKMDDATVDMFTWIEDGDVKLITTPTGQGHSWK